MRANCYATGHSQDRFNAEPAEFAENLFALRDSGAGDDFVRCAGEDEVYAVAGVRGDGCGKVQGCEVDGFGPVAIGIIVTASVELAAGDGVVADAFGVAVAIDQDGGLEIFCGASWLTGGTADFYWNSGWLLGGGMSAS